MSGSAKAAIANVPTEVPDLDQARIGSGWQVVCVWIIGGITDREVQIGGEASCVAA